jgi:hypothetical protein
MLSWFLGSWIVLYKPTNHLGVPTLVHFSRRSEILELGGKLGGRQSPARHPELKRSRKPARTGDWSISLPQKNGDKWYICWILEEIPTFCCGKHVSVFGTAAQQTSRDLTTQNGDWTTKRRWSLEGPNFNPDHTQEKPVGNQRSHRIIVQLQSQLGKTTSPIPCCHLPKPKWRCCIFSLTLVNSHSAWIKISCTHI